MIKNSTKRFSGRVEDYIRFRPSYPEEMIKVLEDKVGLNKAKIIADIGSGTGISSIPFLEYGNYVYSVEPNNEMREAQERILHHYSNLKIMDGTAEQTKLKDKSIDIIFCGQAFHWFNKAQSKQEFSRILKEGSHTILAWNERSPQSGFQKEYEQILLKQIEEYQNVNHKNIAPGDIAAFFSPEIMHLEQLNHTQEFNLEGLKGRLKSSSYCPKDGEVYERLMKEMEQLFSRHQVNNKISFDYETKIYWC